MNHPVLVQVLASSAVGETCGPIDILEYVIEDAASHQEHVSRGCLFGHKGFVAGLSCNPTSLSMFYPSTLLIGVYVYVCVCGVMGFQRLFWRTLNKTNEPVCFSEEGQNYQRSGDMQVCYTEVVTTTAEDPTGRLLGAGRRFLQLCAGEVRTHHKDRLTPHTLFSPLSLA